MLEGAYYPSLYTRFGDELYSVNSMPETDQVQLFFSSAQAGPFTIEATENAFENILIKDTKTGVIQDMSNPYTFNFETSDPLTRFIVLFPYGAIQHTDQNQGFQIFAGEGNIVINNSLNQDGTYSVINLLGQEINKGNLSEGYNTINTPRNGYYITRISTSEQAFYQKVYVH